MTNVHLPNALDTIFLAIDEARRRCGLPGADLHAFLILSGEVDLPGLRRAVRAMHRRYPVTNGRLQHAPLTGAPSWRLNGTKPDANPVIRLEHLDPPTHDEFHRRTERLLATRVDWSLHAPVRFTVFRGMSRGDVVLMRYPHALMDALGGVVLIELLARYYDEKTDPDTLSSANDELRTDFGTIDVPRSLREQIRLVRSADPSSSKPQGWRDIRLYTPKCALRRERSRYLVRELSSADAAKVRDAAMSVCGFARFADFLRACAVFALHRVAPRPLPRCGGYSTQHLLNSRSRRDPAPVCRNVFSMAPIYVPATLANDRSAIADLITQRTAQMLHSGGLKRRLTRLALLARLPHHTLAALFHSALRAQRSVLPLGVANPPSLPLTFTGPFSRPMERFCGARLLNCYGLRLAAPRAGVSLSVNAALDRMNICAVYFESRVSRESLDRFIDAYIAALMEA